MVVIHIKNKIRLSGLPLDKKRAIISDLTYDNPEYSKRIRQNRSTWNCPKKILDYEKSGDTLIVPRGYLQKLKKHIRGLEFEFIDGRTDGMDVDWGPLADGWVARDYQVEAIEKCSNNNGILIFPAGGGKTFTGLSVAARSKKSTLWLTHKKDLIDQAKEDAKAMYGGIGKIGHIGGGKVDYGDGKLIVASIKTLHKRPEVVENLNQIVGQVVIDELHNSPAKQFKEVIQSFSTKYILGLTATPTRPDGMSFLMYNMTGEILYKVPDAAIRGETILTPDVRYIPTKFKFTQASMEVGDSIDGGGGEETTYNDLLEVLLEDEDRKKLIVDTILDNYKGVYSMVYSQRIEYAQSLEYLIQEEAKKRGIEVKTVVVHGSLGKKAREEGMRLIKEKEVDILIGTAIFKEGLNIPHLTHCHLTTPMKGDSKTTVHDGVGLEQTSGRICRKDKSNPNKIPVIFDYCDLENGIFKRQSQSRTRTYRRLKYNLSPKPIKPRGKSNISKLFEGF